MAFFPNIENIFLIFGQNIKNMQGYATIFWHRFYVFYFYVHFGSADLFGIMLNTIGDIIEKLAENSIIHSLFRFFLLEFLFFFTFICYFATEPASFLILFIAHFRAVFSV
jgi:hypothetical protein